MKDHEYHLCIVQESDKRKTLTIQHTETGRGRAGLQFKCRRSSPLCHCSDTAQRGWWMMSLCICSLKTLFSTHKYLLSSHSASSNTNNYHHCLCHHSILLHSPAVMRLLLVAKMTQRSLVGADNMSDKQNKLAPNRLILSLLRWLRKDCKWIFLSNLNTYPCPSAT
jgi:hypothetical protein